MSRGLGALQRKVLAIIQDKGLITAPGIVREVYGGDAHTSNVKRALRHLLDRGHIATAVPVKLRTSVWEVCQRLQYGPYRAGMRIWWDVDDPELYPVAYAVAQHVLSDSNASTVDSSHLASTKELEKTAEEQSITVAATEKKRRGRPRKTDPEFEKYLPVLAFSTGIQKRRGQMDAIYYRGLAVFFALRNNNEDQPEFSSLTKCPDDWHRTRKHFQEPSILTELGRLRAPLYIRAAARWVCSLNPRPSSKEVVRMLRQRRGAHDAWCNEFNACQQWPGWPHPYKNELAQEPEWTAWVAEVDAKLHPESAANDSERQAV